MLANIRVDTMRPSLQAAGRFDAVRAKARFLDSFKPSDTRIVFVKEEIAGFFVIRKQTSHFYLDHLYIVANFQGGGIGRRIIDHLKEEAIQPTLPIRLLALNGSPSNEFYQSCGFEVVSRD